MKKMLIFMSILLISQTNKQSIYCDIKGNVNKPGVYEIKENYTINDVIKESGGLKDNSYTNKINLSKKVVDEMVIYIPTKYEIYKLKESNNCDCSNYVNVCNNQLNENIPTKDTTNMTTTTITTKEKISTTNKTTKPITSTIKTTQTPTTTTTSKKIIYPININNCSVEDLLNIKGLGEIKAKKIIEYREINGLFTDIEDIKNVSGIGDVLFNKIKEFIAI